MLHIHNFGLDHQASELVAPLVKLESFDIRNGLETFVVSAGLQFVPNLLPLMDFCIELGVDESA